MGFFHGFVQVKGEKRGVAHGDAVAKLPSDERRGGLNSFQRRALDFFLAHNTDVNLCRPQVIGGADLSDADNPTQTRIFDLPGQQLTYLGS